MDTINLWSWIKINIHNNFQTTFPQGKNNEKLGDEILEKIKNKPRFEFRL